MTSSYEQGADAEPCIGCKFSDRSLLERLGLVARKGPFYKKSGCPGMFRDLVAEYDVLRSPRYDVVEACPDQQEWEDVLRAYPFHPKKSWSIHDEPLTVGMDTVEEHFRAHIAEEG